METNRQRLERLGMMDDETIYAVSTENGLCEVCEQYIVKNLDPQNPACEGRWCDEAIDYWLDEEAVEED